MPVRQVSAVTDKRREAVCYVQGVVNIGGRVVW